VKIRVITQFTVTGADDFDAETNSLMSSLLTEEEKDPRVAEVDLNAVLSRCQVAVSLVVDAETWAEAESIANAFVRASIGNIGGVIKGQFNGRPASDSSMIASVQSTELVPA